MRRLLEAVKHSVGGVAKGLSSKITKNIDRDHTNPYPSTFPNQPAVESITFKSDWRLRAKPLELYPISKPFTPCKPSEVDLPVPASERQAIFAMHSYQVLRIMQAIDNNIPVPATADFLSKTTYSEGT